MQYLLIAHGAIVITLGNLCGFPLGKAQQTKAGADQIHAWKVAHSGLCAGGVMMVAFGCAATAIRPVGYAALALNVSSLLSGYGFAVSLPLTALLSDRENSVDLRKHPWIRLGNLAGALGSLVAAGILATLALTAR